MKTIETTVYEFDELSDSAKEKARDWYREGWEFPFSDDCLASLKALAKHFGGKLSDYQIDWYANSHSSASFSMPELEPETIESLLAKLGTFNKETLRGDGECVLTGYCSDEAAIDGFRQAWHGGERDLEKLMDAAFETWLKEAQSDCEWQNKDEQVDESITANAYTFTESGKRYG